MRNELDHFLTAMATNEELLPFHLAAWYFTGVKATLKSSDRHLTFSPYPKNKSKMSREAEEFLRYISLYPQAVQLITSYC